MPQFSVFDIIGPCMTGPSSSHTAGAVRLAHVAWKIAGRNIKKAKFILYGSFAQTGRGHGTDKALIAGMLGLRPDDEGIAQAYELARERGMEVEVGFSDEPAAHPNTARIIATNVNGEVTEVVGQSIGGGNIRIVEINGLDVELTGDYPTLIVQYQDAPGVVAPVTHVLSCNHINIAFMRVFRHDKGADAYMAIESDQPVPGMLVQVITSLSENITKVFCV